jgi:hypothetical protein
MKAKVRNIPLVDEDSQTVTLGRWIVGFENGNAPGRRDSDRGERRDLREARVQATGWGGYAGRDDRAEV